MKPFYYLVEKGHEVNYFNGILMAADALDVKILSYKIKATTCLISFETEIERDKFKQMWEVLTNKQRYNYL